MHFNLDGSLELPQYLKVSSASVPGPLSQNREEDVTQVSIILTAPREI